MASAFACGVMAGFLYSLKRVNPSLEVEVGAGSLLMFLLGAGLTLSLWNIATRLALFQAPTSEEQESRRRWRPLIILGAVLFLGMFISYGYAIKDIRRAALLQVLQGTSLAVFVLAGVGVVLVRLARMLNRNEPPVGSTGVDEIDQAREDDDETSGNEPPLG